MMSSKRREITSCLFLTYFDFQPIVCISSTLSAHSNDIVTLKLSNEPYDARYLRLVPYILESCISK